jgi:hypothetical protein
VAPFSRNYCRLKATLETLSNYYKERKLPIARDAYVSGNRRLKGGSQGSHKFLVKIKKKLITLYK